MVPADRIDDIFVTLPGCVQSNIEKENPLLGSDFAQPSIE
jgi:hypothetical protein